MTPPAVERPLSALVAEARDHVRRFTPLNRAEQLCLELADAIEALEKENAALKATMVSVMERIGALKQALTTYQDTPEEDQIKT